MPDSTPNNLLSTYVIMYTCGFQKNIQDQQLMRIQSCQIEVSSFKIQGVCCSNIQLPLMLAYVVSIHRSRGTALYKVTPIIDVGDAKFQVSLT